MATIPVSPKRPRLAAVVTAVKKNYHGERQLDRFLDGYGWNGAFHHPAMDVVSLYVDQKGARRYLAGPPRPSSPAQALSHRCRDRYLRHRQLAVDGVIVVGEQGVYPLTTTGIIKHPHCEFFAQIIQVFRDSGRSVPYFNDKELSYRWDWSQIDGRYLARTRLPAAGRFQPPRELADSLGRVSLGATVTEALSIYYGPFASYDFHAIETPAMHGRAARGWRDRRRVDPGLSRRKLLAGVFRRRLVA